MSSTIVAVDLAKTVCEVVVAGTSGHIVAQHRLTRRQFERFLARQSTCHVIMEAGGTAHYWGRLARSHGHDVSWLPAQYVRPFVRRQKTDRTDAEALVEAMRSGSISTVARKTVTQQEIQALHRMRQRWVTTRTARINAARGFLREHGHVIPPGARAALATLPRLTEDCALPRRLRLMLALIYDEIQALNAQIRALEGELAEFAREDTTVGRLQAVPGVGVLTATALVASVGNVQAFRRGRQFASWLGLTPREHSSGWHRRLGAITKQGDVYLRGLVTTGARAVLLAGYRRRRGAKPLTPLQHWALRVADRRGHNKATIAVANKLARILWAVWHHDVAFTPDVVRPAA